MAQSLILCGEDMDELLAEGRRLAAEWLCREQERPCQHCRSCRKVLSGQHVDVTVINEGPDEIIKVAAIRAMRGDMRLKPFDGEGKAALIAEAQNLNAASQNALLTLLEEPPPAARLILLCRNIGALLPTVRSRCSVFRPLPAKTEAPPPELLAEAERYAAALSDCWALAALAMSWEKRSRDELISLLGTVLLVLRQGIESDVYRQKMETVIECIGALRQNASVGSVCGILMC